MSDRALFNALLLVGGLAALFLGVVLTSENAAAAPWIQSDCIYCSQSNCDSPPPGYGVGHKDKDFEDLN